MFERTDFDKFIGLKEKQKRKVWYNIVVFNVYR